MGNKQILAQNNETLASILSKVLGLPSQESLKHGAYVWKKLTAQGGDFVDFVVSDSETVYPDGGEQDGYWYERVSEGVSGIVYGTITPTANTLTLTIEHNLGKVPKDFMVVSRNTSLTIKKSNALHLYHVIDGTTKVSSWYSGSSQMLGTGNGAVTLNETIAQLTSWNTNYFVKGCEYLWIARA